MTSSCFTVRNRRSLSSSSESDADTKLPADFTKLQTCLAKSSMPCPACVSLGDVCLWIDESRSSLGVDIDDRLEERSLEARAAELRELAWLVAAVVCGKGMEPAEVMMAPRTLSTKRVATTPGLLDNLDKVFSTDSSKGFDIAIFFVY